jgi:hypothetical protein
MASLEVRRHIQTRQVSLLIYSIHVTARKSMCWRGWILPLLIHSPDLSDPVQLLLRSNCLIVNRTKSRKQVPKQKNYRVMSLLTFVEPRCRRVDRSWTLKRRFWKDSCSRFALSRRTPGSPGGAIPMVPEFPCRLQHVLLNTEGG